MFYLFPCFLPPSHTTPMSVPSHLQHSHVILTPSCIHGPSKWFALTSLVWQMCTQKCIVLHFIQIKTYGLLLFKGRGSFDKIILLCMIKMCEKWDHSNNATNYQRMTIFRCEQYSPLGRPRRTNIQYFVSFFSNELC